MDNMKIKKGGMLCSVISPIIERKIKKKTGVKTDLVFGLESVTDDNGKTHVHIDLDCDLSEEDFKRLKSYITGLG